MTTMLIKLPPFAHHPPCGCYDGHLLRVGGVALCLGCSCLVGGALLGSVLILLASPLGLAWWNCVGVGLGLYMPTLLQPFCQAKPFKIFSRSMLGAAVVALWFGAAILPETSIGWILWGVFVATFIAVAVGTLAFRRRFTPAPDARCPFGRFPLCEFRHCQAHAAAIPTGSPMLDYLAELRESGASVEYEPIS